MTDYLLHIGRAVLLSFVRLCIFHKMYQLQGYAADGRTRPRISPTHPQTPLHGKMSCAGLGSLVLFSCHGGLAAVKHIMYN